SCCRWSSPEAGEQKPQRELEPPPPQILLAQRDLCEETAEVPVGGRGPDDRVHERGPSKEPALDPERVHELTADLPPPPRLVGRELGRPTPSLRKGIGRGRARKLAGHHRVVDPLARVGVDEPRG